MDEVVHLLDNPQGKIIGTIVVLLVLSLFRYFAYRLINKRVARLHDRYVWRQTVSYVISITALLLIVRLWFEWFQSILTLLSLVAAALVIVSKELILNGVAYGIILWRQLFDVGDRIQVGTFAGDVIETGPFYFSIAEIGQWVGGDEATGRVVKVPNSMILTQPVANYTRGESLIWNELTLELTVGSNWQRARTLAAEVAEAHTYRFKPGEIESIRMAREEIIFVDPTPRVYLGVRESKLVLTIRYVCKLHKRRATEQAILEDLLLRFADADDIHLAGTA
ncbi:hypothetical protein AWN76_001745 [Rhodothermaceae bacterium RA]|nr:hypothetical protein AWN76_001745 [Rhodothermaceae bacterium RA]